MIKNICDTLGYNFVNRVKNPFLGTFTLVVILQNWKIFYSLLVFSDEENRTIRIEVIDNYISHSGGVFEILFWATLTTFLVMIITYIFLCASEFISNFYDSRSKPWSISKATKGANIIEKEKYNLVVKELDSTNEILNQERLKRREIEKSLEITENKFKEIKIQNSNKQIFPTKMVKEVLAKDNIEKRIELYSNIIEMDPKYIMGYNMRGYAYAGLRKFKDAIKDFNKVIELDPNDDTAYFNRGGANIALGRIKEAIEDYNNVIRLAPNNEYAYISRGNLKSKLTNYNEAIKDYDMAIKLNPKNSEAFNSRGETKLKLEMFKQAEVDIKKALKIKKDPTYACTLAEYYREIGDFKSSLEVHQKSIDMDKFSPALYEERAITYRKIAELEKNKLQRDKYIRLAELDEKKIEELKSPNYTKIIAEKAKTIKEGKDKCFCDEIWD